MAKLSQQLDNGKSSPERQTRTQRVAQSQKISREKKSFENLKAEAQAKQQELQGASFEEYEQEYNVLDPDLKQFFSTPQEVLAEKNERISSTAKEVNEKISYYREKIQKNDDYYDKKIDYYKDKGDDDRADKYRYKQKENEAEYEGWIEGFEKGLKELQSGKDISYQDIRSYAGDVANYEEAKQEARNEGKKAEKQQLAKIEDLEKRGYTPQVIEKSFKGNPTAVDLSYYNKATGDWQKVASYDVKGKVDVSNLKRVGSSAPTQRSLTFAGKDYKFTSRVGIYKEKSGDLVTPYEKTGLNEDVLVKQSQDKAFEEWQGTQKNKIDVPFKVLTAGKELPLDYGQGTIMMDGGGNVIPKTVVISEQDYYSQKDKKLTTFGVGSVWSGVKSSFKWVDDRVHYTGDLSFLKFGKIDKPTDPELASQMGTDYLSKQSQKLEDWAIGKDKIDAFEKDLETKYSGQYQDAFEKKYMKSLIYNETDIETATKEFASSDEAKLIQRRYQDEFETGYEDLQISPSRLKKFGAGSGRVGLSLGSLGLKAVSSPTKTALASGGVYGGVKLLSAIPSVVSYSATGGLFAYGTYKAVDPKSTIDEAGSGLVTAVLSGATLGYAGYKYLRSPVIKTVSIKQPKMNLKASEVIGKDIKIITDKGSVNKIIFQNQKLSQTASAGRRTIVSTKGRVLANRFWRGVGVKEKFITFESNAITRGLPSDMIGKSYKVTGLRGSTIVKQPSNYQKAFLKLTKYGWSDAQAKATLRYIAPRVTEQYLSKGVLTVKGSKAIGEFEYLTKRPVIEVDKSLGIKTRGSKTVKDVYDVQRKLINIEKTSVALEEKTKISMLLDKKGKLFEFTDDFAYSKSLSVGKASKTQKGFEYIGKDVSGADIFKEAKYKDLMRGSVETKLFPRDNLISVDYSKTKLFQKIIDLDKNKNVWVKPTNIKKTPFIKQSGSEKALNDVVNKLSQNKGSTDFAKIIDKLDDVGSGSGVKAQSKFYGTGQYEQSFGGLSSTQQQSLQQQLKLAPSPSQIKSFGIKDLVKVKGLDLTLSKVGQLSSITSMSALKSKIKLKSSLKIADQLKINVAEDVVVKTSQVPALKTSPALKSQLKSLLELGSATTGITPPSSSFKPPKIPTLKTPTPKPVVVFFPSARGKGSNASLKKAISEVAYLPDFTSRALGLTQENVSTKKLMAKINQMQTGFEVRRSVNIVNDKDLNFGKLMGGRGGNLKNQIKRSNGGFGLPKVKKFKLPKEIKIKW